MKPTVLLILTLLVPGVSIAADEADNAGYRSDLWKMEYHQDEADDSTDQEASSSETAEALLGAGLDLAVDKLVANAIANNNGATAVVDTASPLNPSQTSSSESTPGGTLKIRSGNHQRAVNSSVENENESTPASKGPSILTLFVALVAGVVIVSAVFSGGK